jgi:TPR repeat protein
MHISTRIKSTSLRPFAIFFVALIFVLAGCSSGAKRGRGEPLFINQTYFIDAKTLPKVQASARQGSKVDALRLANYHLYISGKYDEGIRWHEQAAESGDPLLLYNHGFMLSEIQNKKTEALKWLNRAKAAGCKDAASLIRIIQQRTKA